MQTKNTRLAAALIALGCPLQRIIPEGSVKIMEFTEQGREYERAWCNREAWALQNPSHPFTYMRAVADARDWILDKVVHGNHNVSLAIPEDAFTTNELRLACCLVAYEFYLYKLDKAARIFYFAPGAFPLKQEYDTPLPGGKMEVMKKYLTEFEKLNRQIQAL